jgi:hypothetical protein
MLFFIRFCYFLPRISCPDEGICLDSDNRAEAELSRHRADKPWFCLEVEPAEGARPEVQATAITVKGTPARARESMAATWRRMARMEAVGPEMDRFALQTFHPEVMPAHAVLPTTC